MARKSKKVSAWDKHVEWWDKFAEGVKRELNMDEPGKHYWAFVASIDVANMQTGKDMCHMSSPSGNLTGEELRETVAGLYMDIAEALNGNLRLDEKDGSVVLGSITHISIYPVYEILEETYDPEEDEYVFSPPKGNDWNPDTDQDPIWSWSLDAHTRKVAGAYSTPPLFYAEDGWAYVGPRDS